MVAVRTSLPRGGNPAEVLPYKNMQPPGKSVSSCEISLMEKLKFLIIIFGIYSVQGCDNFRNDYLVLRNDSSKFCEPNSSPRGSERQIINFFRDYALITVQLISSVPENSGCKIQMDIVYQEATRLNLWALRLLDSSAKLPSGILSGNLNQFGDFDECLSSKGHFENQVIQGKYCLANVAIKIDGSQTRNKIKDLDAAIHSNWILHNEFRDQGHRIPKFETFNVGVCIPSSCTAEEVEAAFSEQLNKLSKNSLETFEVSVNDEVCYVKKEIEFSMVRSIVLFLFLFITGLVFLSTAVDIKKVKISNSKLTKILLCFSLKRNLNLLLETKSPAEDIKCIHGARFLNAIALLLSHKQIAMLFSPILNRTQMSNSFSKSWTMIGRAAILYTDSFIFFSGLLVSYSIVKDLDNKKVIKFKDKLVSRIVRLLPNLFGVILFCTYIVDSSGTGPQWGLVVSKYTNLCKKYMWRNFLFIHNYFGFENMCLTHTHQLGIDMQLFLMSPIFTYIIWKFPKMGTLFLTTLSAISTWLRYNITYREGLSTLLYYGISVERLWRTANMSYIMPTHRLTVYLLGIMLGYYLRRGGKKMNLSILQTTIGWIVAVIAALLAVFGPYQASYKEYIYEVNDAANFNAFAPILWTTFLSWGLLACLNDYGGILKRFLEWKYFIIFTRISYALYLTQFPVFFYNVGTERTAQYYKGFHSMFDIQELIIIFTASIVLTLSFDIPFQELRKILKSATLSTKIRGLDKLNEETPQRERRESRRQAERNRLQLFG